jgi:hypothetical protein
VFSKPEVKELLLKYTLVQLYTDVVPPQFEPTTSAKENRQFQAQTFGDSRLPLYVILRPIGEGKFEEVARYEEGKINHVDAFKAFLSKPVEPAGSVASR